MAGHLISGWMNQNKGAMTAFSGHPALRRARRLFFWMLRPGLVYRRLRELRHARSAPPVRRNLDLASLPVVQVRRASTSDEFEAVLRLYGRNPSTLDTAPRTRPKLEGMIARGVEFYRILDAEGEHVGNIGFHAPRRMFAYLLLDYPHRGRGLALAAKLAAERDVLGRGVDTVYSQILRDNRRALSTSLSLGWEVVEEESTPRYFALRKDLAKFFSTSALQFDETNDLGKDSV